MDISGLQYGEFEPFTEEYSIYLVSRKKGQPKGYSTRDMSNDYADIVQHNFGGHVDIIIGTSFGGMIAQHFAADYPDPNRILLSKFYLRPPTRK